jgi:AcrR family transcriptional regulator
MRKLQSGARRSSGDGSKATTPNAAAPLQPSDGPEAGRTVAAYERAPERRRKELLDSALLEFSTKGYGGARTDAIVARTNSNKAMIFYYFGSKEGLYIAVLEEVYAGIRRSEAEIDFESLSPEEALKRLIAFTFNYYIENPSFVRMINNENLHEAIFLKRSETIEKLNTSIISKLCGILDRGVEGGVFRGGVDPVDLYISISALGFMYVSNQHTLGVVFGRNLFRKSALKARLNSMTDMVMRYVEVVQ